MTIHDDYLIYQEKYEKQYGKDKTIVLCQVGSFHEAYSTETRGPNLREICDLLGITLTRKDKSIDKIDEKNPYMAGFPSVALTKFLNILMNNNYTVIVIDQVTPPPNPKREVTGIYSPATYIEESFSPDANNLVCLYIIDEPQKNSDSLMCIGMSVVDLSTGFSSVHEAYSINGDEKYALDEAFRFINSYKPKETIIYRKEKSKLSKSKEELILYLELENKLYRYYDKIDKNYETLQYQRIFLEKIFPIRTMLNIFEALDLENKIYGITSYVLLLNYAYQQNDNIVKNLNKPEIYKNNIHLNLGNNAVQQLNILDNNDLTNKTKINSLFDVVNNTSTSIGRRYLKYLLTTPLIDKNELILRYNCVEEIINKNIDIEKYLQGILDIERLHRKISLGLIHPFEFLNLLNSYREIQKIIKITETTEYIIKYQPNNMYIKQLNIFIEYCDKVFNYNEMKKYLLNDIDNSFFNLGFSNNIDNLQNNIDTNMKIMDNFCSELNKYIDDNKTKTKFKKNIEDEDYKVSLKKNDRDGYYLSLTKIRAKALQKNLEKVNEIKITNEYKLRVKDLEFKELPKGNTKIFCEELNRLSNEVIKLRYDISTIIKDEYVKLLKDFHDKYNDLFKKLTTFIGTLDILKSNAKTAKLYNYTKPTILENKNGYIKALQLRHPIVERIKTDVEYIPHDVELGKNKSENYIDGMLVFGINSAGKSVFMKAVGISVIMAQCGMYVPAVSFEYTPYNSLFARISGNDNLFKGLSSFALEMVELRAILKRTGPYTLVIGDEICRGTEHISGNALVSATIIQLSKTGSSFIFATHLHEIPKMKRIQELKNVKSFHLTVEYDKKNNILIFDRILKEGSGEPIYGITVANYLIHDSEFMKLAQEIKNDILCLPNDILPDKKSRYNSKVYIYDCSICNKKIHNPENLNGEYDTHHINFQKDCENGFVKNKPHVLMNSEANLLILCKECHHKVHNNKIKIKKFMDTSIGRKLDINKN